LYYRLEREKGDVEGMGFAQNDIATVMVKRGDLAEAAKSFSHSRDAFHEVRSQDSEAYALSNLSAVLLEQGKLMGADKARGEALAIFRQVGDKDGVAYALINTGNILDARGDLAGAKNSYTETQAISDETSDQNISAHALDGLAAIAAEQGDLDTARNHLLGAIALWDKVGIKLSSAESRLALAAVSLNRSNITEAQTFARQALEEFQIEKATNDIIIGHTVLARSLLAGGNIEEAGKEISAVGELAAKTQNAVVRLQYEIDASRIRAQSGHRSQAEATLNSVRSQASKAGMISYKLESCLALGEIKMKAAEIAAGRTDLASLKRDANARGYVLIARKAEALMAGPQRPY
jgi:ATP/maltotriose-dependent transcriptional regulator MalT